jgi:glycosyltransferase involved in cell wall biosynthesis
MATGTPVVATSAVGAAAGGLLRDGRNGIVVPERDPEKLAGALSSLVREANMARSLGMQGREDVSAFTYARMARAFTDAIDHAVSRH